ncbi:helix-turn-helix domain-containing protein [Neotamlana laminarinivorans]|uniref:Helix-turn-helix domain-containing protein n=1 Tax=Neotamlana laminarinivorans TaxID=2883124 RepID=A0A9X1I000_9FLAO|nr:helix-turn-helix transcriptional regulator [Tamlana laminarinivorans]MCB4797642.1 helix-turn-helix domain-containing protein [Tamlana laminarinivorans]
MVNSIDFIKRLQIIIDYYGESASSFAQKIGVQRSSISHILSGRNKPSLDFVLKIFDNYPEVDLYWLFNGKGEFPKKTISKELNIQNVEQNNDLFSTRFDEKEAEIKTDQPNLNKINNKRINRIVIFYSDGTFENYNN